MTEPIIYFNGVSKSYQIIKGRETTLKEKLIKGLTKSRFKETIIEKKILKDFDLEVLPGETIGIIGENGAGKSTTLKLIAKIIQPDKGEIVVRGKVASLLEIGAGFQPDMTGKENVYLYGTILGLSKKYINSQYRSIVEFAELHDFMDTPVKNYSSGMYMRLAFSVAIHVDPEIIIIDEVLAVGDYNFQKKCLDKLEDFQAQGKTIVFVSHDMTSVRKLCDRVVYLYENGRYEVGPADQMVNLYFSKIHGVSKEEKSDRFDDTSLEQKHITEISNYFTNTNDNDRARWGNGEAQICEVTLSSADGKLKNTFLAGEDIGIHLTYKSKHLIEKVVIGLAVFDDEGKHLCGPNSKDDGIVIEKLYGEHHSKIIIKEPPFLEGTYYLTIALYDNSCRQPYDHLEKYFVFHVSNVKPILGKININCKWLL